MPNIDLTELAAKNPGVDRTALKLTLDTLRELREKGLITEKSYDIAPPFSRPSSPHGDRPIPARLRMTITRKICS